MGIIVTPAPTTPPTAGRHPLRLSKLTNAMSQVSVGMVVALTTISSVLSYAALLFGTASAGMQAQGLFALLLSVVVLGAAGAAFSTLRASFISHDGASIAAMAAMTAALITDLAAAEPQVLGATILVGLAGLAGLTGLVLVGLGRARGGAVVRFLPVQVTAGLLAATGWSLTVGGATVAAGQKLTPALLVMPNIISHILPAVVWAGVMMWVTRRVRAPAVMPGLVFAGVGLHHLVFGLLSVNLDQQRAMGWLLRPPGQLMPVFPWTPGMLNLVDWSALAQQAPAIATTVAVTCLLVLVNAGSVELQTQQDLDLDVDLRANGIANLLTGLVGGIMGNLSSSRTGILHRLGVRSRWVPLGTSVVAGLIPMAAPELVGLAPRWVLGALVLVMGLSLLDTWLLQVRRGLSRVEWLTVPVVVAVSVFFGLPAAVFAGLALGCVTFAFIYSRTSPIRARYKGDIAQSNVDRSEAERASLFAQADAVLVLYLQGFLFFGTANRLLAEVKAELALFTQKAVGTLRFLVLDCSNIDGLDGSARATLERLHQVTAAHGIFLIYAALPAAAIVRLGALLQPTPGLDVVPTLDAALEQVEAALLGGHHSSARLTFFLDDLIPADAAALEGVLTSTNVAAGEILMVQDEASEDLMFLVSGQAEVVMAFGGKTPVRVRQFGPGTMIGEIGFFLGTPRTATVSAITDCMTLVLTRTALHRLEAEQPNAALALQRAVMSRLSRRLLDKDHLIAALVRGTQRSA